MITDKQIIDSLETLNRSVERMSRRLSVTRFALWIAAVLTVVALVIAVIGIHAQVSSTNNTRHARVAACDQYNGQQSQGIVASDAHDVVEAANIAPLPRTPAVAKRVEAYLKQEHTTAVKGHPLRNCSLAGIAKYLRGVTGKAPASSTTTRGTVSP